MPQALPDFYNDLEASFDAAKSLISAGAKDRRCPAHHPVVGTIAKDGTPQQRVMILRAADWQSGELRFHTDTRSGKANDLAANPQTSVLIYDEGRKVQLRLSGTSIISSGTQADPNWDASTLFARRCYLAQEAPGSESKTAVSGLPAAVEGRPPTQEEVIPARRNFAVMLFSVHEIEWLYLANDGHRRAKFSRDNASSLWQSRWLVP